MIFYQWGRETVPLGSTGRHTCPHCGATDDTQAVLGYRYFALWWIFSVAWGQRYYVTCGHCGAAEEVGADRLGPLVHNGRIPFWRRYGLGILVTALVLLGLAGAFSDGPKSQQSSAPGRSQINQATPADVNAAPWGR